MKSTEFYQSNISIGKKDLKKTKAVLFKFSMLRLSIFLIVIILAYLFRSNLPFVGGLVLGGIILFLLFVSRFTDAKQQKRYFEKYIALNELELAVESGNLNALETGEEFVFENHHYNQDIDLFGAGSLFQMVNRSETKNGKQLLSSWLNSNDISNIDAKQATIQEISKKANWRQDYKIKASLIESNLSTEPILEWIKNYEPFIPRSIKVLPVIFSLFSAAFLGLYFFDYLPGKYLLFWFILGLGIVGKYVKKGTDLYNSASQMQETFGQYSKLIALIETEKFDSEQLQKQQNKIQTTGLKASTLLSLFTKRIDSLGQRNNIMLSPVVNGFCLLDIRNLYNVEKWLIENKETVAQWFEVIEFFDALNSMGNYAFNNEEYIYPKTISDGSFQLDAHKLGHPLLRKDQLVPNDITIGQNEFFIITGANMAGKSTFLRTVALNIVMANCGLPVSASKFDYTPIKLISSMRTSDSLQNDESYFFSELKRLKFIVDEIKTDRYFIILDEILKGTNSKDKAEGSMQFIQRLAGSTDKAIKCTGIVATHDLSLCTLSDKLSNVHNHYFDADIIDDELFFDYTFKKGICQNMNASFLLKKMEII
ncbi:MAG: DNA mismatch repair protein MutS [Flavobacteriales bacterium]|nr:DNA mismatch repair protein MutS [Flavobacteriales bacterium]